MGKVAALGQVHAEDLVARVDEGQVGGHVGLAAGVGLDVGVLGAEKLFGAFYREVFRLVDLGAAAVVAAAGIAFGVFVGEAGSLGFENGRGGEVFRGDKLDAVALAGEFGVQNGGELGIGLLDVFVHGGSSSICL